MTGDCSQCGSSGPVQMHHTDYRPESITKLPLCQPCHSSEHTRLKREGVTLPGQYLRPAQSNREPIMIRIPPELLNRIDAAAKRLGLTRSAFIVQASARALGE
jgi:hypothetical protein